MENREHLDQADVLRFKFLNEYADYLNRMTHSDLLFMEKHNVFTLAQAKYCLGKQQEEI
jgi:hypothetical protein